MVPFFLCAHNFEIHSLILCLCVIDLSECWKRGVEFECLSGVAFLTVFAILTVLAVQEKTLPSFACPTNIQGQETTIAVLAVVIVTAAPLNSTPLCRNSDKLALLFEMGATSKNKSQKPWASILTLLPCGNRCRFSESAICFSQVHPPSKIKWNKRFKHYHLSRNYYGNNYVTAPDINPPRGPTRKKKWYKNHSKRL